MARCSISDPLERFRFAVTWSSGDGSEGTALVRLGFHDIQTPKRNTTKIMYREGIDPDISQISAGLSSMEDITLSRGLIASDRNNEFYKWVSAVHKPTKGHKARTDIKSRDPQQAADCYRKDLTITVLDREGNAARKWILYSAFPVNFVPGSDLDASEDGDKSLEALTIGYEDFEEIDVVSNEPFATSSSL